MAIRQQMAITPRGLAPPRAAAIAGVIFSVLMSITLVIVRMGAADRDMNPASWLNDPSRQRALRFAIQLVPFAGIAFLWLIGVLRTQLGELEDQFFATVFLGSGLLFVASLFASAALAGAFLSAAAEGHTGLLNADFFYLSRRVIGTFLNVFGVKMAGVFLTSASTLVLRTGFLPRWVAFLGFACAAVLLLTITNWPWIALVFPAWMLLVSVLILLAEFHPIQRSPAP